MTPVYASVSSDSEHSFARASSAIFVCYTLILLGYFIGLKKSILVLRQCVPYLGLNIDSIRQSFILLEEKKAKFIAFMYHSLSSNAGKCVSFSYAVPWGTFVY